MAEIPEDTDSGLDAMSLTVPQADIYSEDGYIRVFDKSTRTLLQVNLNILPGVLKVSEKNWEPI